MKGGEEGKLERKRQTNRRRQISMYTEKLVEEGYGVNKVGEEAGKGGPKDG